MNEDRPSIKTATTNPMLSRQSSKSPAATPSSKVPGYEIRTNTLPPGLLLNFLQFEVETFLQQHPGRPDLLVTRLQSLLTVATTASKAVSSRTREDGSTKNIK
jgi:hypothetical protein